MDYTLWANCLIGMGMIFNNLAEFKFFLLKHYATLILIKIGYYGMKL